MQSVKIHFSDFFNISPKIIAKYGAFNVSLVRDMPLFIDPFLLFNSTKPEYQILHSEIIEYLKFLRDVSRDTEIDTSLLKNWFYFSEVNQTWLGYSKEGSRGRGLAGSFAQALNANLHKVFTNFGAEQISRSSHLEKLCLIKTGVGRDTISDFTTNLIKGYLLSYTQEFAKKHIARELRAIFTPDHVKFNYQTRSWKRESFDLPTFKGKYVLLTPRDILTRENTWINRTDLIESFSEIAVSIPNDQLRAGISQYFKLALSEFKGNPTKKEREEITGNVIMAFPEILDHYIKYKEDRGETATAISQERVAQADTLFVDKAAQLANYLFTDTNFYKQGNSYEETHKKVAYLKTFIEHKGGHRIFEGREKPREEDVQLLFKLVWEGTVYNVSSEVDDGRGPVDFQISYGSNDKTHAEFKLASNSQLKRNLQNQAEIYEKASDTKTTIHVIVFFTWKEDRKVHRILQQLGLIDSPDIVVIDARSDNKPSGSKA